MRMIDADAFVEDIKTEIMNLYLDGMKGTPRPRGELYDIIDRIGEQPTIDAVEVVHGRWEQRTDVNGFARCSVCHDCNIYDEWPDGKKWKYCPNCGAKMDAERQTNG